MANSSQSISQKEFTAKMLEALIRVGLVVVLFVWCFKIVLPFAVPVVWGIIIAVAIFPGYIKLNALLGGRDKLSAALYLSLALGLLITPTILVSGSFIDTSQYLLHELEQGSLSVPTPNSSVKQWPLVGEKVYSLWAQASVNLEGTLKQYAVQIKKLVSILLSAAAGAGGGILQFVISVIISAILLTKSVGAEKFTVKFFQRLAGEKNGLIFTNLTRSTIRSVAQGVVGVAIIQSILAAVGLYLMGIPGWGLWTVLILVLAVAQLPTLLVLGPIIAYVFSVSESTPAIIFAIWSVLVSMSDSFLKPLFLGRGMGTPTWVILLGAIGGMMLSGILGLFVGAIILTLGYELFMAWLEKESFDENQVGQESAQKLAK